MFIIFASIIIFKVKDQGSFRYYVILLGHFQNPLSPLVINHNISRNPTSPLLTVIAVRQISNKFGYKYNVYNLYSSKNHQKYELNQNLKHFETTYESAFILYLQQHMKYLYVKFIIECNVFVGKFPVDSHLSIQSYETFKFSHISSSPQAEFVPASSWATIKCVFQNTLSIASYFETYAKHKE